MLDIFYITNDVERALVSLSSLNSPSLKQRRAVVSWQPSWSDECRYTIVTFQNPYSRWLLDTKTFKGTIVLVKGVKQSTEELLKHKKVITLLGSRRFTTDATRVIVFKPTVEIEEWCKKMGWKLLNPSSKFGMRFEEKIAQSLLFKKLRLRTPKTVVTTIAGLSPSVMRKLSFPFVLQFNLGHTGEGTYVIRRESDLESFRTMFPKRPIRATSYVDGVPLTVNGIVGKTVYCSSPSLQITGIPQLTPLPFATVGNDWSWCLRNLQTTTRKSIQQITETIGGELKKKGYVGAFGVDVVLGHDGKLYVIEVNARQVNSCVYESYLQIMELQRSEDRDKHEAWSMKQKKQKKTQETTMSLYVKCLLGLDTGKERLPQTLEGSQLFIRAQTDMKFRKDVKPKIIKEQFFVFSKLNKGDHVKKNAEVLRIQSREGMIEKPMKLKQGVVRLVEGMGY